MAKVKAKPKTLDKGEYFEAKEETCGISGNFKVEAKVGNFYLVQALDQEFTEGCMAAYPCPFADTKIKVENHFMNKEVETCSKCKPNEKGVTKYTCLIIAPKTVSKLSKLVGLFKFGI